MNVTFKINTLIEWDAAEGKTLVERILFIDPSSTDVVTINVNDKNAFPDVRKYDDLREAIIADRAHILHKAERYATPSLPEKTDDPKYADYISRRDEAWELIAPLIEIQDHKIFNRRERGRSIAELSKQTGRRKKLIYDYLRRYWQRGLTKDALIPVWQNCGYTKDGSDRKSNGKKVGRKSAEARRTGVDMGRNVTPEDKEKFDLGIKKFIRTGKAKNLLMHGS